MSSKEERPRILTLAGSTRRGSYNRMIVRIAGEGARRAGAEVGEIDLAALSLPLFDQDLESAEGMPEDAIRLRDMIAEADGLLIASPEYNSSLTGVLKNAIDWASRRSGGEGEPVAAFEGKAAVIMSEAIDFILSIRNSGWAWRWLAGRYSANKEDMGAAVVNDPAAPVLPSAG